MAQRTTTAGNRPTAIDLDSALRRVVLVANRKGGVYKSALCRSVAGEAAAQGLKVCVVDGDPQGNVSKIDFGIDTDAGRSLAIALQFGGIDLEPQHVGGVDVVMGGPELDGAVGAAMSRSGSIDLVGNFRTALAQLCEARKYDLVLIDSGPGDTVLLDTWMRSARYLIVPTNSDDAALDGVDLVGARYVRAVREGAHLDLLGAVLVNVDPRAVRRNEDSLEQVTEILGSAARPFTSTIRYAQAVDRDARRHGWGARDVASEAAKQQRSRLDVLRSKAKPNTRGGSDAWWSTTKAAQGLAEDYAGLTQEILKRIADHEKATS